uniref:Uncharacterized protein n=1 Tax=Anguilla anguilla TaxID=7936 RepID=A0A0E9S902_ANGAN
MLVSQRSLSLRRAKVFEELCMDFMIKFPLRRICDRI